MLSVAECCLFKGVVYCRVLSIVECCLSQSAVCWRVLSIAECCLSQSAVYRRVLSIAECCLSQSALCSSEGSVGSEGGVGRHYHDSSDNYLIIGRSADSPII
jgi:hypothetical protein